MEAVKFDRVVSVNSELQGHPAKNILDGEISPNKNWMCEKGTEKAVVILQMNKPIVITSVHVGNAHSAFLEILVGRAADNSDQFESLIPMSVLMPPHESKTSSNPNTTRFFKKEDFNEATASKAWDRMKVVCSQPFNKYVPYGLCFLKVYGEKKVEIQVRNDGDDEEIQVGSFFKKKRSSEGDKPLTVSEQIKEAEKETSLSKHIPLSVAKISEKIFTENKRKTTKEKTPKRKQQERTEVKTAKRKHDEKVEEVKLSKRKKEDSVKLEKKKRKPFGKLMEDVVLVISGFKNPLRGDIRSMALKMGAKYSADWESHCTHLVCAYENTPKSQQVRGKGKIVKKEWVEKCYEDRKRYPWRRFALDKTDLKKPESEEEIEEVDETQDQVAGCSKDEDVKIRLKQGNEDYEVATDEEKEKAIDTTDYPMPFLPDLFDSKVFYVDPNLQSKPVLERYIVAYNGILAEDFSERVDFYITEKGGAPVDLFRDKAPNLLAIKPSWIWEINSKQKFIPTSPHLVK